MSKKKKESPDIKIHAHIIAWNEERILPFTLRHYLRFCEQVHIWDNFSDDNSMAVIEQFNKDGRIKVHRFDSGGTFDDLTNQRIKNHGWKVSKGQADYVIVVDCDELVWHQDIKKFIADNPYTCYLPEWCNMATDVFPNINNPITEQVTDGVPNIASKMVLFSTELRAINYTVGAHIATPIGENVSVCTDNALKLLHYKHLSADYVIERYKQTGSRFSENNKLAGWGVHHLCTPEQILRQHQSLMSQKIRIVL
jgi:hypothetical protein